MGSNVIAENKNGKIALDIAASRGNLDCIELLIPPTLNKNLEIAKPHFPIATKEMDNFWYGTKKKLLRPKLSTIAKVPLYAMSPDNKEIVLNEECMREITSFLPPDAIKKYTQAAFFRPLKPTVDTPSNVTSNVMNPFKK